MPKNSNSRLKEYKGDEGKIPSKTFGNGFVEIIDDNFDKTDWGKEANYQNKGKWVIRFEKDNTAAIDAAWEKVKKGVADGVFMEAKFDMQNDKFPDRVIIIYTFNREDHEDVRWVHNEILKRGIADEAITDLVYISDAETKKAADEEREPQTQTIQAFSPNPSIQDVKRQIEQQINRGKKFISRQLALYGVIDNNNDEEEFKRFLTRRRLTLDYQAKGEKSRFVKDAENKNSLLSMPNTPSVYTYHDEDEYKERV